MRDSDGGQSALDEFGEDGRTAPRRARARDRLERAVTVELPGLATFGDGWPVHRDHCFRRIAYDQAVRARWDDHVGRPFVEEAPTRLLRRAAIVANAMTHDGPREARFLDECSLLRRGELAPADCEHCDPYWVARHDRRRHRALRREGVL
jgi:hypothetical protein